MKDNTLFSIVEHVKEGGMLVYPYPSLGANEKILEVRVSMTNGDALVQIVVREQP
jgi:hypothetical protein